MSDIDRIESRLIGIEKESRKSVADLRGKVQENSERITKMESDKEHITEGMDSIKKMITTNSSSVVKMQKYMVIALIFLASLLGHEKVFDIMGKLL